MKKIFYLMALLPMLFACTEESTEGDIIIVNPDNLPSTQVFVQGSLVDFTSTRAEKPIYYNTDYGYGKGVNQKWPKVNEEDGYAVAKFSIRIDASFPGVIDQAVNNYWTTKGGENLGKVYLVFPWDNYNDRDLDYYKIDKKTGNNTGLFKYVLDPFGKQVTPALMEVPDMKAYCKWLLERDDTPSKDLLQQIYNNWDDYQLVWYVAKEVGGKDFWHVNGYFTKKSFDQEEIWKIIEEETDDMEIRETKTDDNVEIDIHQQEHKDWYEIKTSIHIRTDVQHVQVKIPIALDNIVEADNFTIRVFNYYISGIEIKNLITHDENGITIDITNIDPTVIEKLKAKFGDGLTIEVHSFCKKDENGEIWKALKNCIMTTGTDCSITYHISSALVDKDKWINYSYVAQ